MIVPDMPLADRLEAGTALPPAAAAEPRARFAHVDTWVFDLDNTLYPAGSDLWPQIDARITHYLADIFGLDGLSARALQKYYYQRYGTTLHGLMAEHAIDPHRFTAFVHDIDRTRLPVNPALGLAIAALPGRKLILTSGSRDHALKTTAQLGIGEAFEAIFDIASSDFVPKPDPATYDRFFADHAVDPARAAMFEDLARNLEVPHARGMLTTLVVQPKDGADHREPWERTGVSAPYVDYVTDDIVRFLVDLGPMVPGPMPEPLPLLAGEG